MPTNLTPDYFDAEKRYRAAKTVPEKISCLEEMLRVMPKHKGTDKLHADLRKRLSKLKTGPQTKKSSGRRDSAYQIDREGAGQAIVIGQTNVGKSSLIAKTTNANPEVSASPFTTWNPTPGMMPIENIQVQLIDTPPLNREFVEPDLFDLMRRCDLILLMVDIQGDPLHQLEESMSIIQENRILPIHMQAYPSDIKNPTFIKFLLLVNKCDDEGSNEDYEIFRQLMEEDCPLLPVSAETGRNVERMKLAIFEHLEIVRVYSKTPGEEPDLNSPFVLKMGSDVTEFARKVHLDFYKKMKSARVWGSGAFEGQMIGRDHILKDGDIVELKL